MRFYATWKDTLEEQRGRWAEGLGLQEVREYKGQRLPAPTTFALTAQATWPASPGSGPWKCQALGQSNLRYFKSPHQVGFPDFARNHPCLMAVVTSYVKSWNNFLANPIIRLLSKLSVISLLHPEPFHYIPFQNCLSCWPCCGAWILPLLTLELRHWTALLNRKTEEEKLYQPQSPQLAHFSSWSGRVYVLQ